MGNHLFCATSCRTTAAAKVIRYNDGGIQKFWEAIKVGELMVEDLVPVAEKGFFLPSNHN